MAKKKHQPLPQSALQKKCDPKRFAFETTDDIPGLQQFLGQNRALKASALGVEINCSGFNIFAMGPVGLGKRSIIRSILNNHAQKRPTPDDLCYIHNFNDPKSPKILRLKPGLGKKLAHDIEQILSILRTEIPAIFESKAYIDRIKEIEEATRSKEEEALSKLEKEAADNSITILRTPQGFMLAFVKDKKIISEEEFQALPDDERHIKEEILQTIQNHLKDYLENLPVWRKELQEKIKEAVKYFTMLHVGTIFSDIKNNYKDNKDVLLYLNHIEKAILEHPEDFGTKSQKYKTLTDLGLEPGPADSLTKRYGVNVLVDHGKTTGAPVIYEDNPILSNLVGRIDHVSQFGAMVTDFTQIRPGSLHKANGGYLILDAHKILTQPYSWEGLKRALRTKKIHIENINQFLGIMGTIAIEPEALPLDIKVVLVGDRSLYYLLSQYDPEFLELFKVAADFDEKIDRTVENENLFAQFLKNLSKNDCINPLSKAAVAEMVNHASIIAGDREKISTHASKLTDLLREAHYCAEAENSPCIEAHHIEKAFLQQIERSSRLNEERLSYVERGFILIETAGKSIGQVNGLAVSELAGFMFGHPVKISARASKGRSGIIDIEREVKLGGPIHSKGVFILAGYLAGQYRTNDPMSAAISLVFEQSYGGVEGDSASLAEACAILSDLSEVPIKQSVAVTGSVNQHGQVQAVGGINEKILGFFEIVKKRGFKEPASVIIPKANIDNLMLRNDIVEAVSKKVFSIYAVSTIDEAMEILTDKVAGNRNKAGHFARGTINYKVEQNLKNFAASKKNKK